MPLLNKRSYSKKKPYRDATLFVIICEGGKREPEYFEYFDGLTSRIKVRPIPSSEGKSSPNHLVANANEAVQKFELLDSDEVWFVIDVDRWKKHIHDLWAECEAKPNWLVAISNPCFEVWLYYHFQSKVPKLKNLERCSEWKSFIATLEKGGFDSSFHPALIKHAITNSKNNYKEDGYIPQIGCTQLFTIGEKIYELVKKVLA